MHKRLPVLIAILVVAIGLYAAGSAFAVGEGVPATAKINLVVTGNPLDLTPSGDQTMTPYALTGDDGTATGSLGILTVRDPRGTGAGWYVSLSGTNFVEINTPANTISNGGFSVPTPPAVVTVAGNGGVGSNSGTLSGGGITLLDSPNPNGRGRYETTPDLALVVPAETFAGTYTSTVTETLISY